MTISPEAFNRIITAAAGAFFQIARRTPSAMNLMGGRILGLTACRVLGRHRHIARANLRFAFQNEKDLSEIDRLVRQNFQQWGMIAFEWAQGAFLDRSPIGQLPYPITVKGVEHLKAARQKSRSVMLLSAHFGNWEYGHLYYASHFNILNFIVRRIDNPYLETRRVASNQHHGVNILYKERGLKTAIKNLRQGQDLVIFADQKANPREGIESRFFGRKTTSIPLVASFATKFQLPIVPMFVIRQGNGPTHELTFLPELEYGRDDSIAVITQHQNDIIEQMIRKHPDHWLWVHRRWKTEYPEIYRL